MGEPLANETLEDLAGYWTSLQYRQYLKLALETLFRVTEFVVHDAVLGNRARDVSAAADAVGAYAAAGLPEDVVLEDVASRLLGVTLVGEDSLYRNGMRVSQLDMKLRMTDTVIDCDKHRFGEYSNMNFASDGEPTLQNYMSADEANRNEVPQIMSRVPRDATNTLATMQYVCAYAAKHNLLNHWQQ